MINIEIKLINNYIIQKMNKKIFKPNLRREITHLTVGLVVNGH